MDQQATFMDLQAEIMKLQYNSMIEPKIIVHVQSHPRIPQYIMLIIKNIGGGMAYNLKFNSVPDFCIPEESLNQNYDLFKKGIQHMAPNQKIEYLLTDFSKDAELKRNSTFSIEVTYYDELSKGYFESYLIELYQFWGMRYIPEKSPQIIVKNR